MSMGLLRLLRGKKASAPVARERLQILLAHERGQRGQPDLLGVLREEILAVVSKHVKLDPTKVIVRLDRGDEVSTLEVDIEVPNDFERKRVAVDIPPDTVHSLKPISDHAPIHCFCFAVGLPDAGEVDYTS